MKKTWAVAVVASFLVPIASSLIAGASDYQSEAFLTPNATGFASFKHFHELINRNDTPGTVQPSPAKRTWTWSMSVAEIALTDGGGFETGRSFWLNTSPVLNLSASDPRWNTCILAFPHISQDLAKKGQDDDGSCSTTLGNDCLDALTESILRANVESGSTQKDSPCGIMDYPLDPTGCNFTYGIMTAIGTS